MSKELESIAWIYQH